MKFTSNTSNERVIVIVPVYNTGAYLKTCIDSILNQTYKNLVLLLINDGSSDDTGKVCEAYAQADSRVIVHHKENGGVAHARNYGLDIARHIPSDYVLFVDHDDYLDPTHVEELHTLLTTTNADIAISNFTEFINDRNTYRSHVRAEDFYQETYSVAQWFSYQYESKYSLSQCFTVPWAKLYKKHLLDDIVYPVGKKVEDDYTTYKIYLNAQKISYMNKANYIHRKFDNSVTGSSSVIDVFPIQSIEERIAILSSLQMDIKRELDAYRYRLHLHANAYLEMGNMIKYKETILKLKLINN